jgi:type I restriction enzyme M protein
MRKFATESGKSKGQFYTPAEVSRILAKIVGIENAKTGLTTLYDPACGSGSLLIRAAEAAPVNVTIYGEENTEMTAGLAKMNLVIHNRATAEIRYGNTFADPFTLEDKDNNVRLRTFDFAVVNPPFSDKKWTIGINNEDERFKGYGAQPPQKNGDYAWLLHVIKSLKRNGKAAIILPHGVLFRGNAEATIRQAIIDKGFIKGIIGLPANLFYGTGIPACIIVIDKENADERDGIFMIDASHDFVKDGNKNRLRERDVYKITSVFNNQEKIDKYSRFVPNEEIKVKNDYNLNIPRYIDSSVSEDIQSIDGHLNGGIPAADVDSLKLYWSTFPKLQSETFASLRKGFYSLAVKKGDIRDTIYNDADFSAYADKVEAAFENWKSQVDGKLRSITNDTKPKELIADLAKVILREYEPVTLVDKYDAYEVLLLYWNDVMADDVYMLAQDGYGICRDIEVFTKTTKKKKKDGTEETKTTETGWDGRLIPRSLIVEMFFPEEQRAINDAESVIEVEQAEIDEIIENAEDDSVIQDVLNDKGVLSKDKLKQELKTRKGQKDEDTLILLNLSKKVSSVDEKNKLLKKLKAALENETREQYPKLTDDECLELLINRKWYAAIINGVYSLYTAVSHAISDRVTELTERYEYTLPQLEKQVSDYEKKVKSHLERMGFVW